MSVLQRSLFVAGGLFMHAVALKLLWFWFVMPLTDVGIDTVHAAGLIVLLFLLKGNYKQRGDIEFDDEIVAAFVIPTYAVIVGAMLRLAMHPLNYAPNEGLLP